MREETFHHSTMPTGQSEGSGAVLRVGSLSISIGRRTIVKSATFTLFRGGSLAVIGPNGSGKTLLLKALLGLQPYTGTIDWEPGTRLGYVPQNISADRHFPLRARELLQAKARVQRRPGQEVDDAAAWVGVPDLLDQRLGALSSGQLQRVLIAFALIGAPDVLLVDEPTSSLDEPAEEHFFELLNRARRERGTTVVLVSHDLTLVRGIATHVLCLSGGVAWFGTAAEMLVPQVLERVYGQPVEFHSHHLEQHL
jgi:zinc transport system ATP-binding protein